MKKTQFKVGDKAVCPAQGVAEVAEIVEKEIAGVKQSFYVLKIIDSNMRVMIPTSNADAIGLRELVNDKQIKVILSIIGETPPAHDNRTWNRRYRGFMEKIKTGNLFDIAEVFRDLSILKNTKSLSFGERRMLELAKNLIVKEIAISRKKSEEKVLKDIEKPLRKAAAKAGRARATAS
jgi:CarD family transcriptional regulator